MSIAIIIVATIEMTVAGTMMTIVGGATIMAVADGTVNRRRLIVACTPDSNSPALFVGMAASVTG